MPRIFAAATAFAAATLLAAAPAFAGALSIDVTNRQAVVALYNNQYAPGASVSTGWTSNGGCDPGRTSAAFQNAVLDRINYYRVMAGLPTVALNATFTLQAQAAAHLISVNKQSNHYPPATWTCYSAAGAAGAARSNLLYRRGGMAAIDSYMRGDGPANKAVGHRRWILNPPAKQIGVGDVPAVGGNESANALYVVDIADTVAHPSTRDGSVSWPPPGYVPYNVVFPRWHYSQQGVDFSAASVLLTLGGVSVPTEVVATGLERLLGFISFRVHDMGDSAVFPRPTSDQRYSVTINNAKVGGVARTIRYNVTLIDPVSIPGDYNFDGLVNAADYTAIRDGLGARYTPSDLATWRANYGARSAVTGIAAPEPASLWTLLTTAAVAPARRARPASRA
jgi:uncharacterized protein YkwD